MWRSGIASNFMRTQWGAVSPPWGSDGAGGVPVGTPPEPLSSYECVWMSPVGLGLKMLALSLWKTLSSHPNPDGEARCTWTGLNVRRLWGCMARSPQTGVRERGSHTSEVRLDCHQVSLLPSIESRTACCLRGTCSRHPETGYIVKQIGFT